MERSLPLTERIKSTEEYTTTSVKMHFLPSGWAIFHIDEHWGSLSIESDWGSYNYAWGHGGRGVRTLRDFLSTCSTGYIAEKLCGMRATVPAGDRTRREMMEFARQLYKDGRISQDEHKELVFETAEFARLFEQAGCDPYHDAGDVMKKHFDPLFEFLRYEIPSWHRFLCDHLIPTFQAYLRGEAHAQSQGVASHG